jgi:hypothetical protein
MNSLTTFVGSNNIKKTDTMKNSTTTTINHNEFIIDNHTLYQFELDQYIITYMGGHDNYRVINVNTKKQGIIMVSEKNRNIESIKNEMAFLTGRNNLKICRPIVLDQLN